MTIVGVISGTHGLLRPEALTLLQGTDRRRGQATGVVVHDHIIVGKQGELSRARPDLIEN